MALADWEILYRWDWFRREAWRGSFRDAKRGKFGGSCACVAEIAKEYGPKARVLDASSGFGLKTVVMKEMGADVVGSDACAFAVEKARELAKLEGAAVDYFASTWAELPRRTSERFPVIFIDALSWIETRGEFEASLAGILGALAPGGVFVFMGATEGSHSSPEGRKKLLDETMARRPRLEIDWKHEAAGVRCTSIAFRERGEAWVDEHHIYLVEQGSEARLESATVRQPVGWDWPVLAEMFARAGFASLHTREFPGRASDGGTIRLNLARKGP